MQYKCSSGNKSDLGCLLVNTNRLNTLFALNANKITTVNSL